MRPVVGVVKGVVPAVKRRPILAAEQPCDIVVAFDGEESGGAAEVFDLIVVKQLPKRSRGAHDGVSRWLGKMLETNPDGTVFDRALVALGQEQHLAVVGAAAVL